MGPGVVRKRLSEKRKGISKKQMPLGQESFKGGSVWRTKGRVRTRKHLPKQTKLVMGQGGEHSGAGQKRGRNESASSREDQKKNARKAAHLLQTKRSHQEEAEFCQNERKERGSHRWNNSSQRRKPHTLKEGKAEVSNRMRKGECFRVDCRGGEGRTTFAMRNGRISSQGAEGCERNRLRAPPPSGAKQIQRNER